MRKEITLAPEILKGIKILAAQQNTNAKNYIENLVTIHVETKQRSKKL